MAASMDGVRRRLDSFLDLKGELRIQAARLSRKRESAGDLRSPSMEPGRSARTSGDEAMCRRVAELDELAARVSHLSDAVATEEALIERAVSSLRNVEQREVLILRYLDAMDWDDIVFCKYGDRADYLSREEEFRHAVYCLHNRAIAALSCVMARVA